MKKIGVFLFITILSIFTISCSNKKSESADTKTYDGRGLSIGIIGESPEIREKQVTFTKIGFKNLEQEDYDSKYAAIFITKDNLYEAAQQKYAQIYKNSDIPFFFIQSDKSYVPFIQEDLSYEDAPVMNDLTYVTGIKYEDNILNFWGYGLFNDIENQANIEDVYSRIFGTISDL